MVQCPACHSERIRRSARRGIREGLFLRMVERAPFRCIDCGHRFTAPAPSSKYRRRGETRSIWGFLGVRRGKRRKIILLVFALGLALLFALLVMAILYLVPELLPLLEGS